MAWPKASSLPQIDVLTCNNMISKGVGASMLYKELKPCMVLVTVWTPLPSLSSILPLSAAGQVWEEGQGRWGGGRQVWDRVQLSLSLSLWCLGGGQWCPPVTGIQNAVKMGLGWVTGWGEDGVGLQNGVGGGMGWGRVTEWGTGWGEDGVGLQNGVWWLTTGQCCRKRCVCVGGGSG
jgi:hypothetical protein